MPERLAERAWWPKSQSSAPEHSFTSQFSPAPPRLAFATCGTVWLIKLILILKLCCWCRGFHSSLLRILLRYGPNTCSTSTKVWQPLSRSERRRNRPEITVLMCEQTSDRVWFSLRRKSYPVQWEYSSSRTFRSSVINDCCQDAYGLCLSSIR